MFMRDVSVIMQFSWLGKKKNTTLLVLKTIDVFERMKK